MGRIRITAKRLDNTMNDTNEDYLRECDTISLDFDEDFTGHELNVVCRRLAAAMGYSHETVNECFAPESEKRFNSTTHESLEDFMRETEMTPQKEFDSLFSDDDIKSCDCDQPSSRCDEFVNCSECIADDDTQNIGIDLFQKIVSVLRYVSVKYDDEGATQILSDIENYYKNSQKG